MRGIGREKEIEREGEIEREQGRGAGYRTARGVKIFEITNNYNKS